MNCAKFGGLLLCEDNIFNVMATWLVVLGPVVCNESQPVGNIRLMCMGLSLHNGDKFSCNLILIFLQIPQYVSN